MDYSKTKPADVPSRKEQLEQLFELSMDLLCIAGFDGYFKVINPAFQSLLGYSEQEMLSKPFVEFIHPEDREAIAGPMARLADGLAVIDFENRYRRRDGTYCWLAWRAQARAGGDIFAVARDITERKRAEDEQEALRAQMQHAQKLESLGVLAGGIAHDFNNLLVGILGNNGLAQAEIDAGSKAAGFLANIETAAMRAADLANQMLAYAGKARKETLPVDIGTLVVEMAELLRVSIRKKTEIHLDFAETLPVVLGDPTQLRQVVMNLITNAADAIGEEPGEIRLRTRFSSSVEGRANRFVGEGLNPGGHVFLEVQDTGCGIDSATMAKMFDPFYSTKRTGRGLGLAAVQGIIRSHGGLIEVESTPGEGTTFRLALPVGGKSVSEASKTPSPSNALDRQPLGLGVGRALVVDDEVMVRHVAELTLAELGFEILTAPNGRIALELLKLYPDAIDLVLLDLTMPVLDGGETLAILRDTRPEVKVILSSGYSPEGTDPKPGVAPDAYLPKPYTREDLLRVLLKVLAG